VVLVIAHHSAIAFGGAGDWYLRIEKGSIPLTVFCAVNQSFFMGLLFFLAGYFTPGAYARKGAARFASDRLLRLGVPTVVYGLAIGPWLARAVDPTLAAIPATEFFTRIVLPRVIGFPGPLWFVVALLVFSFAWLATSAHGERPAAPAPLEHRHIALLVVGVAAISFAVRFAYPIGRNWWVFQLAFFPQYVALFWLGTRTAGLDLAALPTARILPWALASGAAFLAFGPLLVLGGGTSGELKPYLGGAHWQAAALALWEQVMAAGICLTLVRFASRWRPLPRAPWASLSANAYAIYVVHAPAVVAATLVVKDWPVAALLRFLATAIIATAAAWAAAAALRALPPVRRVL
jgi:glucan biosynthesis protein C